MNLDAMTLVVPAADPRTKDLDLDMRSIYNLEQRQREVATINKVTAPELMQAFIDGYGFASRHLGKLELELNRAENALEERKAVVYLDEAPRILREKKVVRESNPGGSEDQRKAVLAMDLQYRDLKTRYDEIEAAAEFLRTKMKSFEMSYQAVKKVYDSLSGVNALTNGTRSSGYVQVGTPDPEQGLMVPNPRETVPQEQRTLTIGKPHYK